MIELMTTANVGSSSEQIMERKTEEENINY
jgi:hypothetical protein